MTVDDFAYREYRECVIYTNLLDSEKDPGFRRILESIIKHETAHYNFWNSYSKKTFKISKLEILLFKLIRKLLGLTFTLKVIEGSEKDAIRRYQEYLKVVEDPVIKERVKELIRDEQEDERNVIESIKEERIEFLSNIILGLNDAMVELTGALIGFSFAFRDAKLVAVAGLITGVAASLSMGSSAYMQASYEKGKNPIKAGLYTLSAYFTVVVLLVFPFFIMSNIIYSFILMVFIAVSIIAFTTLYTTVLFARSFSRHFVKMLFMSLGVAVITFLIGTGLKKILNIDI